VRPDCANTMGEAMGETSERRAPTGQRFVLASDHAAYELKEQVKRYLEGAGNEVDDLVGKIEGSIDYPVVAEQLARKVVAQDSVYGVLMCGTGIGASIAANKVDGVRAALLYSDAASEYARAHNNANVLVFGGRTMAFDEVRSRIEAFFSKKFEGGRHQRRNDYIAEIQGRNGG
jgi:ribose 5-phosphate isomerase B